MGQLSGGLVILELLKSMGQLASCCPSPILHPIILKGVTIPFGIRDGSKGPVRTSIGAVDGVNDVHTRWDMHWVESVERLGYGVMERQSSPRDMAVTDDVVVGGSSMRHSGEFVELLGW